MNNKSCYDCVHREVCASVEAGFSRCVEDVSKCKYFMDKSDFEPVRHGKWELVRLNNNFIKYMYKCSICNKNQFGKSEYCPNCGAKMGGKEV